MTLAFAPERIEQWPLARLQPYAKNAKLHGPDQVAKLAASMAEFGWTVPCLVGEGEGEAGAGGTVPPVVIPEPPRNPASRYFNALSNAASARSRQRSSLKTGTQISRETSSTGSPAISRSTTARLRATLQRWPTLPAAPLRPRHCLWTA